MVLGDYNLFLSKYPNYSNIYNLFINYIKTDFSTSKNYYTNLFFWENIKFDILLYISLPFIYLLLILIDKLHIFLLLKLLFYTLKYILKYIFYFIDILLLYFISKLDINNKYIIYFIKILYTLPFTVLYKIYLLFFEFIPLLLHYRHFLKTVRAIQNFIICILHKILDLLEWIPTSSLYISSKNLYIFLKKVKNFSIFLYSIRGYLYTKYKEDFINYIIYLKYFLRHSFYIYISYYRYYFYAIYYIYLSLIYTYYLLGPIKIFKNWLLFNYIDNTVFIYTSYLDFWIIFENKDYFFLFFPFIKSKFFK